MLPGRGDVTAVLSVLSPVAGSLTVTEPVMVTVAPTATSPVHSDRAVRGHAELPELAVRSPL